MNRYKSPINPASPKGKKNLIIIGGGFGGINLVKKLKGKNFNITLIDKNNYHTFQPLLYQVATGGLEPDSIAYPIRKIFNGRTDFIFRMAELERVDPVAKTIQTSIGTMSFDFLILAAGSKSNFFGQPALEDFAMPMKTLTDALDLRSLILQNMEMSVSANQSNEQYLNFIIAGGGPTGVETAGALCELKKHVLPADYSEIDFKKMRIILAESGPRLLAGMSEFASENTLKGLTDMGVEVKLNSAVESFNGNEVIFKNGEKIPSVNFIWSAGVKGVEIKGIDKSAIGRGNRIRVDRFNRVQGLDSVFAIGDLALMEEEKYPNGHPMVAQVAIQQAENLAFNLQAIQNTGTLKPFRYKDLGSLATIGRNKAVADFSWIKFKGFTAWMLWMAVHLMTLVGFRNRVVVFVNWLWSYFSYDRAIRLIIRPFIRK